MIVQRRGGSIIVTCQQCGEIRLSEPVSSWVPAFVAVAAFALGFAVGIAL